MHVSAQAIKTQEKHNGKEEGKKKRRKEEGATSAPHEHAHTDFHKKYSLSTVARPKRFSPLAFYSPFLFFSHLFSFTSPHIPPFPIYTSTTPMAAAQNTPTSKEEWIKTADGHELFTKTWYAVGNPVASVVFVHGFGEHIVRKEKRPSPLYHVCVVQGCSNDETYLLSSLCVLKNYAGYDHVFDEFNKAGFQVSAFDQRGFGKTGKNYKPSITPL